MPAAVRGTSAGVLKNAGSASDRGQRHRRGEAHQRGGNDDPETGGNEYHSEETGEQNRAEYQEGPRARLQAIAPSQQHHEGHELRPVEPP